MADQPKSELELMVLRLIDFIRPIEAARAATTTGRCRYMSGAVAACVNNVTQATCNMISLGTGRWTANVTCAQPLTADDEEPEEISPGSVSALVARLNRLDETSGNPLPVGACTFTLNGRENCVETTQAVCEIALQGSFTAYGVCQASPPNGSS
ncbi:MAG: hypothetical protein U0790_12045 [Isosphaeraceae bacterium]